MVMLMECHDEGQQQMVELPVLNNGAVVNSITCLGDQVILKQEQATNEFTSKIVHAIQNRTPLSTQD